MITINIKSYNVYQILFTDITFEKMPITQFFTDYRQSSIELCINAFF